MLYKSTVSGAEVSEPFLKFPNSHGFSSSPSIPFPKARQTDRQQERVTLRSLGKTLF